MKSSEERTSPKLASKQECTACMACIESCPSHAINCIMSDDGHEYVKIDPEKCTNCLKCQSVCENRSEYYGINDVAKSHIYVGWNKNEDIRKNSTSGGVFAALAETVLDRDGCVIGVEIKGFECKHVAIYNKAEIYRIQGSKYMYSSMEDVYEIIKKELGNRDVLFSGLGCQCAGVLSYFKQFETVHHLYTVDLICAGIPSRILVERFKREHPDVVEIKSFRSKEKYEIRGCTKEGNSVCFEKSILLQGFNCELTNRYSCYDCRFVGCHRKTDITIGDFWNKTMFSKERPKGLSTVIIHSLKGEALMEESDVQLNVVSWKDAIQSNMRIVWGKTRVFLPRKKLEKYNICLTDEVFRKLYTMDINFCNPFLFFYRSIRFLIRKVDKIHMRKKTKLLLRK